MNFSEKVKETIFSLQPADFEPLALEVFRYQARENPVYARYLGYLGVEAGKVHRLLDVPFMPIEFFKSHRIVTGAAEAQVLFESSGTTGSTPSQHWVVDPAFYLRNCEEIFRRFYGDVSQYHILALLPNYLERGRSSLVYMVDHLIKQARPGSGFYLRDTDRLCAQLRDLQAAGERVLLIGVTYALLDLAEEHPMDLSGCIIMETGGMKGRRQELLRSEVHDMLRGAFGVAQVHSEYGMTELLSQGYSQGEEVFATPPWLQVLFREISDPFALSYEKRGGMNVIDLANVDSCSFLETKDIGEPVGGGRFKVLGRYDNSDMRGCNLMVQ